MGFCIFVKTNYGHGNNFDVLWYYYFNVLFG
jgi:hypothetical protein